MIKCMIKYFSSEDHDFRNLTKFVRHFSHFTAIFYTIINFQPKMGLKHKIENIKRGLTAGPTCQWAPAQLPPPPLFLPARAARGQGGPAAARHRLPPAEPGRRSGAARSGQGGAVRQAQGGARRGKAQRGGHARARRPAAARGRALGGGGVLARPGPVGGGGGRWRGQGF